MGAESAPVPNDPDHVWSAAAVLGLEGREISVDEAELMLAQHVPAWGIERDQMGPKLVRELGPMLDDWRCAVSGIIDRGIGGPHGPLAIPGCIDRDRERTVIEIRPNGDSISTATLIAVHQIEAELIDCGLTTY
jgi:hypothetical protein